MSILDGIKTPADLKGLSIPELTELAQEIREEIIAVVSANGGHLASSLGVVELTLALHYVYVPNCRPATRVSTCRRTPCCSRARS